MIALIGVGLIGGSIGLAAQRAGVSEVRGFDAAPGAREAALERGAATVACGSIAEAVNGAEAVFVSVPVGALPSVVGTVLAHADPGCVVTDTGSVKRGVVAAGAADERFVGGHPLAGAETAGVAHARADLFDGAIWYLTPGARSSGVLFDRLARIVRSFGATAAAVDAEDHDRMLAGVSHLPHVLANTLVAQAAGLLDGERLPAVGPSFRDAVRVAGAPGAIWNDIYMANADALGDVLDDTLRRLGEVRSALARGDRAWIDGWNCDAGTARARLLAGAVGGGEHRELRIGVPNRPGVVAEIALALGRAGVNIVDMALHPAADMSDGVVAVWVAGADHARAAELLNALQLPVVSP